MAQDYGKTLNLPNTEFPMRAGLPQREPETLKMWEEADIYKKLMEEGKDKPKFILHDGPPFANGDIHIGHALNKILKDIVIRQKTMSGYCTPYVPGWDTHGLPIERQAIKKLGIDKSEVSPVEFRRVCRDFALLYVENQKAQFKRLGILGDWANPYLTLAPEYEKKQIEIFGEMAKRGYIYRGLKPVYWCTDCETALAEAEIEYQDDITDSIFVKFAVKDDKGLFGDFKDKVYFIIWTTTTWTLPGNVAISVNPDFEYSLVKSGDEIYVIASELVASVCEAAGIENAQTVGRYKGSELEYIVCAHPFLERDSLVITGGHVTAEAGTGCVHTAPGHGAEDYEACRGYDVPMIVPVDGKGYLNEYAGQFSGMYYEKSNAAIIDELKKKGMLVAVATINHSYPHCWRCSKPIVYRATEQWFASVDDFKQDALESIKKVNWIPAWGEDRISSMVEDRKDWCISRQRMWGVPIPIFYCESCKNPIIDEAAISSVAKVFGEKGSDSWFELEPGELLPKGFKCSCGGTSFTKETDTMDVWFDSGSSHSAVLETREELSFPADMYLEGNDQYRGWFQSSLLTSVAKNKTAPYRTVLTHGFVIDEEKRKMSKSLGNGLPPLEIINEYGADILRLWAASADYKSDVRISKDILKQLSEVYRKIRNTARYILGSLSDFDPDKDMTTEFTEIDRWALMRLNKLIEKVLSAYDRYEYHVLYHAIHNFCVVDLSNFYLDIIKDRTYCEKPDSALRRSAQSAMFIILDSLVKMLAPILAFTAEEIWQFMPHRKGDNKQSVMFALLPTVDSSFYSAELEEKWDRILELRDIASKELELARQDKIIGSSLGAEITIFADDKNYDFVKSVLSELPTVMITSGVSLEKAESGLSVKVSPAKGTKCARCWTFTDDVGKRHEDLCERCASVLE
ncbi:MAG: Isoleucine--tRNA ligase [Firmicutes bacterium ADurb.Bin193]|nr:MAG: Isoleucine--tRNA ligase [Firmicutes bacterium ADurb.Bin193]